MLNFDLFLLILTVLAKRQTIHVFKLQNFVWLISIKFYDNLPVFTEFDPLHKTSDYTNITQNI